MGGDGVSGGPGDGSIEWKNDRLRGLEFQEEESSGPLVSS